MTRTTRECCPGYGGEDCDITYTSNVTCGNLTCPNHPKAICVTVSHCGKATEIFFDESYLVIKECVPKDLCLGACRGDPCADEDKCTDYPDALCFTDCNCKAMWVLPDKRKRVKCNNSIQKRDTANFCM